MYKLIILSVLVTIASANLQPQTVVPEDSDVLEYVVHIERNPEVAGQPSTFLAVGTLLTFTHIIVPRDILGAATLPTQLTLRFHSNRVGQGFRAQPAQIIRHGTANIAILRMAQRVDQQMRFSPRPRDDLIWNRFCTFYGFDLNNVTATAQHLVATAAMVRNVTDCGVGTPFCAMGTPGQFPTCGGFLGAPATCDGNAVSAIVINDQFCNLTHPHVNLFRLQDQINWINENTSGAKFYVQSVISVVLGFILVKIIG